jgi:GDP-4-dehydro-6-deoxy-D-mannose reductase
MRTLITGINGFVGGHLAEVLIGAGGWDIWGLSRSPHLALSHLREHVRLVQADMNDPAMVRHALEQARPQVVFHLASQSFVPAAFRDPAATLQNNILAHLHLFQAIIEQHQKCRILAVGSNEVYGMIRPEDLPIDETTPFRPANPYGVSKVAQDMLALQYHISHQIDVVRVRPFNHIGPRQDERFVSASFAQQIARIEHDLQPPVIQVGDLSAQRDFTDVRDMVRAYMLAVEHGEAGQVYNIGSGTPTSIQSLLDKLLAASNVTVDVQPDPARMRPSNVPMVMCNARLFRERTGWEPHITLDQTLHDVLNDWRARTNQETA